MRGGVGVKAIVGRRSIINEIEIILDLDPKGKKIRIGIVAILETIALGGGEAGVLIIIEAIDMIKVGIITEEVIEEEVTIIAMEVGEIVERDRDKESKKTHISNSEGKSKSCVRLTLRELNKCKTS